MAIGAPAETSVHLSLFPESEFALQEIGNFVSSNTEPEHAPEDALLLLPHCIM